jgi:hypothetical protein
LSDIPPPGSVIRYSYLWADETDAGREEGTKDRPTLVVAVAISASRIIAVAITHSPPRNVGEAIPLPDAVKTQLGLDDLPSWITVTEANIFRWPGPDIRNIPGKNPPSSIFGRIPHRLLQKVAQQLLENDRKHKARMITRTE